MTKNQNIDGYIKSIVDILLDSGQQEVVDWWCSKPRVYKILEIGGTLSYKVVRLFLKGRCSWRGCVLTTLGEKLLKRGELNCGFYWL